LWERASKKSIERNEGRNLPTDYWSLDLPEETEDYVPRLLAIAKLFAHADEYNIHLQHIPNRPYFEVIDIKSPLNLNKAAKLANTPLYAFMKLNPGFNRSSTAPQGPHRLLVPIAHAQAFKKNLAMLPYSERVSFNDYIQERIPHYIDDEDQGTSLSPTRKSSVKILHTLYKVKPGENLASIAIKNHTTMRSLRLANHLTSNSLRTGMRLQIATEEATSVKISSKARTANSKSIISQAYVIKKVILLLI
jgi:LysM domain.